MVMFDYKGEPWCFPADKFLDECFNDSQLDGYLENLNRHDAWSWPVETLVAEVQARWEMLTKDDPRTLVGGHNSPGWAYAYHQAYFRRALYGLLIRGHFEELRDFYRLVKGKLPKKVEKLIKIMKKRGIDVRPIPPKRLKSP